MWRLGLPEGVTLTKAEIWGARAILQRGYVDLLYDRQGWATRPEYTSDTSWKPSSAFTAWIDKEALPALRKWATNVSTNSRKVFLHTKGEYVLVATPNRSYGYLYITAIWAPEAEELTKLVQTLTAWKNERSKA